MKKKKTGLAALLVTVMGTSAFAVDSHKAGIDSGDTAFVLISAALVMLMTPALAFFYAGMVRKKNVLSVLLQCFILLCTISVQWILFGYSLAFGPDHGGVIGDFSWVGLRSVGGEPNPDYADTIPHSAFMIFQAMFAIITPSLAIGAFVERIKFKAFFLFMMIWVTVVYDPVAHWVWGTSGWLKSLGALDFAGGTVVHINAGVAALVMAILLGKRYGYNNNPFPPHNLPLTVLGAGALWLGWFGFNAGSALVADALAVNAFITTNIAAASAGLMWGIIEWKRAGAPTMLGVVTGLVAGLVAITPACGFVSPLSAVIIGAFAAAFCYLAVVFVKYRLGYDDSMDVFGVHGVGGIWGAIATGLFAQVGVNEAGTNGLLFGNPRLLLVQLVAIGATVLYSGVLTFLIYKVVAKLIGMRVDEKTEIVGLDITEHKEVGYAMD